MSLITSYAVQSNSSQSKDLSTKVTYASTYGSGSLISQLSIPVGTVYVTVKMWGATGCGGDRTRYGGGGYTTYTFSPNSSYSYYISVGLGGVRGATTTTGGTVLRGGNAFVIWSGGSGGDGSLLARLSGSTYTLLAVVGGGGGSSVPTAATPGAGGGTTGQSGTNSGATVFSNGGSGGVGGTGSGNNGSNCTLTASSLAAFGGAGGNVVSGTSGSAGPNTGTGPGGGGGGYGGGASSATSDVSGGGGAGFVNTSVSEYITGSTTTGGLSATANTSDADYVANGAGGDSTGGYQYYSYGGYTVVYYYKTYSILFRNIFTDRTSASSTVNSSFDFALIPQATLSSSNTTTITNATTLKIRGAPIQGTNTSISNSFTLRVDNDLSYFGGSVVTGFPVYLALYGAQTYYNSSNVVQGQPTSGSNYYYVKWASTDAVNFTVSYQSGGPALIVPYTGIYMVKYTFTNASSGVCEAFISYQLQNNNDLNCNDQRLQAAGVFSSEGNIASVVNLTQGWFVNFAFYTDSGSASSSGRCNAAIVLLQRTA